MAKQRPFLKSLRGKVSVQMLLVSLIPILIIGGMVWNSMTNLENKTEKSIGSSYSILEKDVIQETLSQDAHRLALELEKDMATRIDFIKSLTNVPGVKEAILSGSLDSPEAEAANAFLADQLGVTPWFTTLNLMTPTGQIVGGSHVNLVDDSINPGLHPAYFSFLDADFSNGSWWSIYQQYEGDIWVNEPTFSPAAHTGPVRLDAFTMEITAKVYASDGTVIGAVNSATGFDAVKMSQDYAAKYPNTRVTVFTPAGLPDLYAYGDTQTLPIMIAADSGEWALSPEDLKGDGTLNDVMPKQSAIVDGFDDPQPELRWFDFASNARLPEAEITYTAAEERVRSIIGATDAQIIPAEAFTTDNGSHVVGYARASTDLLDENLRTEGYPGTGFTVMTEQRSEVAFEALESLDMLENDLEDNTNRILTTVLIILGVAFVVVLGVAFYLSRGITKPIVQLNDAAEKVSMGELDVNVNVKSNDEIGDLAESFGRMVTAYRFMAQDEED